MIKIIGSDGLEHYINPEYIIAVNQLPEGPNYQLAVDMDFGDIEITEEEFNRIKENLGIEE